MKRWSPCARVPALSIPLGTAFQFRGRTVPFEAVAVTMPPVWRHGRGFVAGPGRAEGRDGRRSGGLTPPVPPSAPPHGAGHAAGDVVAGSTR